MITAAGHSLAETKNLRLTEVQMAVINPTAQTALTINVSIKIVIVSNNTKNNKQKVYGSCK